ncbi:PTS system, cellobiose-specific IIC component [Pilibacter termitis]|uniref:Permease IIC component n=1 Tax=Pilibacter termitis TaxID=263852 RepID=A0A1T4N7R3_9ENTE|nr:PTS sugar transporter subunit IIC [Pilibacter termitis]SJZ75241.1 PTS system, cellobiose-specific IIC component [Pilibacter termitis]
MNDFVNERLLPPVMKFVSTKPMMALRNGMLYVMPFTIIGSIFLLLSNIPIQSLADMIKSAGLDVFFNQAFGASFAIMAFFAVMGIAISYCQETGMKASDAIPAGFVALTNFILLQSAEILTEASKSKETVVVGNIINKDWAGGKGMIVAIIVGLITGFVYSWFIQHDIRIKLPEGVPENVAGSFTALIPGVVLITGTLIVYSIFKLTLNTTFFDFIYKVLQTPLQGMTDSIGGALLMGILIPLLWSFGVHGSTIVGGIMGPILTSNSLDNQAIVDAGKELTIANGGRIVTQQFLDQFMTVTGAGMTIGIVIYMVAFAKAKQYRTLGKLSIVPALFNINEPIIFATPIVMNPIMMLPFIITPTLSALITYGALASGLVPLFKAVIVPWTTPPIISGFLVGGWQAAVLQFVVLALSFFIYLPFIRKMDGLAKEEEE